LEDAALLIVNPRTVDASRRTRGVFAPDTVNIIEQIKVIPDASDRIA
jgi:hypothetical protein